MIKLFKPTIKRKDMDSVLQTLVDEAPGPGEINRELGRQLAGEFGADSALVLRSYIRALVLALKTLELERGARVAVSTLSPACYLYAVTSAGYQPVFYDVDPKSGCMQPESISASQEESPEAVLLHEPLGNLPDFEGFRGLSLPIIEDVSQSMHSSEDGYAAGSLGTLVVLSFEDDSLLCSGGGAAVVVREKKLAASLQKASKDQLLYDLLPDINSSFVKNQLGMLDSHIEKRREFAQICLRAVMKTRHQVLNIRTREGASYNGYSLALLLDSKVKEVVKYANRYKIETKMPFSECALQVSGEDLQSFPNSIPFILRAILFPLYPLLSQEQLRTLVKVLSTLP
ncbi:MAG: DegT/DnrJ/EryC1/StrS family aminotransferase [Spirochaetota bacterium]